MSMSCEKVQVKCINRCAVKQFASRLALGEAWAAAHLPGHMPLAKSTVRKPDA